MEMIYSLDTIDTAAEVLYKLKDQCSIYTFTGSLGAGKTTLVDRLLKKFNVEGAVTSPTFTYLIEYKNDKGQKLYHFDLYRLEEFSKFVDAGFDEYLYRPESWSFIEWPDIAKSLLIKKVCDVSIEYEGESERLLTYTLR